MSRFDQKGSTCQSLTRIKVSLKEPQDQWILRHCMTLQLVVTVIETRTGDSPRLTKNEMIVSYFSDKIRSESWLLWQWERILMIGTGRKTLTQSSRSLTTTTTRGCLSGNLQRLWISFGQLSLMKITTLVMTVHWYISAGDFRGAWGWVWWQGAGLARQAGRRGWTGDHYYIIKCDADIDIWW